LTGLPEKVAYFIDARAWGGAEVYLMQLVAAARKAGIEPHIYCADRSDADAWIDALIEQGFNVSRYRPTKEFNPLGFFVARRVLSGHDVVHINKTHPRNSLPGVIAAWLSGARVIVATEHLGQPPDSHYPLGRLIITTYVRLTNMMIDRTIAVSELSREMLLDNYRIPESKIVAIPNGIDVGRFENVDPGPVRAELGLTPEDRVALFIGRLTARKGHSVAIDAFPDVLAGVPEAKMVFVGNGELEDEFRSRVSAMGLEDRVIVAGFRRDIPELLAASSALILPSEKECLPLSILEAMAAGLPVVATDVGGISEAVEDGVTGLLIEPRDPGGLARALVRVLGDREEAEAMGRAGLEKARHEFSIEATMTAVFGLYRDLLDRKGRR
jgi:glycosyltransferase involved in cell wall biosynthesis